MGSSRGDVKRGRLDTLWRITCNDADNVCIALARSWHTHTHREEGSSRAAPLWRPSFDNPLDDLVRCRTYRRSGARPPSGVAEGRGDRDVRMPRIKLCNFDQVSCTSDQGVVFSTRKVHCLVGFGRHLVKVAQFDAGDANIGVAAVLGGLRWRCGPGSSTKSPTEWGRQDDAKRPL